MAAGHSLDGFLQGGDQRPSIDAGTGSWKLPDGPVDGAPRPLGAGTGPDQGKYSMADKETEIAMAVIRQGGVRNEGETRVVRMPGAQLSLENKRLGRASTVLTGVKRLLCAKASAISEEG